jgi:hypothetical protein
VTEITIDHNGEKFKLVYNGNGRLENVFFENGGRLTTSMHIEGDGIFWGRANLTGEKALNGPMVRVADADILVPYYIYFQLPDKPFPEGRG